MSFNIRYGDADDGENCWDGRKALAVRRIRAFGPDLLGLQECQDDAQADYVRSHLAEYRFHGERNDAAEWGSEMTPLLFNESVFEETARGCFWLSETPHIAGSTSWDSAFARTVTWSKLLHKSSNRLLLFLNTHFDYAPRASEESAGLLAAWLEDVVTRCPVVVTGDFNAVRNTLAYERLAGRGLLFDVHRRVRPEQIPESTYHDYGRVEGSMSIDWILASDHFEAVAADVDAYCEGHLFPSDHYPVTAVLDWR